MSNPALHCTCQEPLHQPKLVVLTGGPGAGKTAVLETVSRHFCKHVAVLPETASMLFRGGFPREKVPYMRAAAQRAIFHVQRELEGVALAADRYAVVLCDRGTLDGLAYWPYEPEQFFAEVGTWPAQELARYSSVIHLRSPGSANGYNLQNPVRIETPEEAVAIDKRIEEVWSAHPRRQVIESQVDFLHKLTEALSLIRAEVPACCAPAEIPALK